MVKKIVCIIISGILLIVDFSIQSNYNYDTTEVVIREEITIEQLIKSYIDEMFENLKNNNFEPVYSKMKDGKFSNVSDFSKYITEKILVQDSLITVEEINQVEKNKYNLKVKVDTPLFTPKEKLEIETYKRKYLNLSIEFDDMFNYKILEFEKIE